MAETPATNEAAILPLLPEHARAVAELHISGITTGFISSLGLEFVAALYDAITRSRYGYGFVAVRDGKVVGFAAFSTHLSRLYASVILRNGLRFAFSLAGKMFSVSRIKKALETVAYPGRIRKLGVPRAELLSIVVSPEARGKGLSRMLTQAGLAECHRRGIARVKVLVGADNQPANALYVRCGFERVAQIDSHGIISNLYVVKTDRFAPAGAQPFAAAPVTVQLDSAFVTYGWCRTTYALALSLGRRGIDVHVSDASGVAMSRYSRYCKSYVRVPDFFIEPDNYFEATCKALEKTGANVLLPAHEDVGIFCRRRNELPKGVLTALPDWESYRLAEDKLAVLDVASSSGCPTPATTVVKSWSDLEDLSRSTTWPIVIKTHIGNSAKGVRIAHSREELLTKYKELVETFELPENRWPFIQEFLPGEAAGVCVLYEHGKCVVSFAERYLRCKEPGKFGTSTLRESFFDQKLISRATAVMDKLKWHGVAHLDFVADKNGDFKLIEVNPRLWGALALSIFAGIDFPYLWYLVAAGKPVDGLIPSQYRSIKCRWLVGDYMAFLELLKLRMFSEAMKVFVPQRRCYHDDFVLTDPLPLVFEIADYVAKFVKAGGSVNPVTGGMVR